MSAPGPSGPLVLHIISITFKCLKAILVNPLYTSEFLILTFANSEDPVEMPHYAAFQLSLQSLFKQKGSSEKEEHFYLESITSHPLLNTMDHPMFFCIKQDGKVH